MASWRRLAALLAVLAVTGLAVAGCGDDDDDGGGGQSKEDYIAELEAVCQKYDKKLEDLGDPESLKDLADLSVQAGDLFDQAVEEARAIEAAEDTAFAEDVEAYLDDIAAQSQNFDDLQQAAEEGDAQKAQEVAEAAQTDQEATDKQAKELGLDRCASAD
jgi:hypothetical protein